MQLENQKGEFEIGKLLDSINNFHRRINQIIVIDL